MAENTTTVRDVATLTVARAGQVEETGDPLLPFRLADDQGGEVPAVTEFLHHMLADNASPASLRSYSYELLAWFRFLDAVMIPWDLAGRAEARDFALWLKTSGKPERQRRPGAPVPGSVSPVTGKAVPGEHYAARTRRHARAVIWSFYEYHRGPAAATSGPHVRMKMPVPDARLEEIHANVGDWLQEARDQGWLGEVAAIETTLAAAARKLQAMRDLTARSATTGIHIGMPDVRPSARRRSPGS